MKVATQAKMDDISARLIQRVDTLAGQAGVNLSALPGVRFSAYATTDLPEPCLLKPTAGIVLSGKKTLLVDDGPVTYGRGSCYLIGIEQTGTFLFGKDNHQEHLRAIAIPLDVTLLQELIPLSEASDQEDTSFTVQSAGGYLVEDATPALFEAFDRLTELVDSPEDIAALMPSRVREIHYRLLTGPWRHSLISLFGKEGAVNRITAGIRWITEHYNESFDIEEVAKQSHMSLSTFNRLFKKLTRESPLQYKRNVRLIMAHRMLETDGVTAETAAWQVGYKSISQFHRDYRAKFGHTTRQTLNTAT